MVGQLERLFNTEDRSISVPWTDIYLNGGRELFVWWSSLVYIQATGMASLSRAVNSSISSVAFFWISLYTLLTVGAA